MAEARPVTAVVGKFKWRPWHLIAGASSIGLLSVAGAAVAAPGTTSSGSSVNRPPQECTTTACHDAAKAARAKEFPPVDSTLPSKSSWLTKSRALDTARGAAETADGHGKLAPGLAATLPAQDVEMTIGQFDTSQGIGPDADISPNRLVWVVTVPGTISRIRRPH
jgi:hypothetical protein